MCVCVRSCVYVCVHVYVCVCVCSWTQNMFRAWLCFPTSYLLTLHLVGPSFVQSSYSVGLRGAAGLLLMLTVGLRLSSRMDGRVRAEVAVGLI